MRVRAFGRSGRRVSGKREVMNVLTIAKTGRPKDVDELAVRDWACSTLCDFRNGAKLVLLVASVKEHYKAANAVADLDLSTRALSSYIKKLSGEPAFKGRFSKDISTSGWKCAPPMSYLKGVLPPNKMVADRRLVAQGKKAKAELNELKKEAKQKERTGALNYDCFWAHAAKKTSVSSPRFDVTSGSIEVHCHWQLLDP